MHEIRIEPCRDAELLATMNREIQEVHAAWYPREFKPWNQEASTTFFNVMLQDPNTFAWVAMRDEMALAYVIALVQNREENAFRYAHKSLHIDQLSVNASFQRQGIGGQLLQHVIQWAAEQKINRITIDHWAQNLAAATLYTQAGFANYMYRMEKIK